MKKYLILLIVSIFMFNIGCTKTNDIVNESEAVNEGNSIVTKSVDNDTGENERLDETTERKTKKIQVVVDALNVRMDADIESEKIGSVFLGSVYEVIDEKNLGSEIWYQVSYEDHFGWIAGWFCEETELEIMVFQRNECPKIAISNYYHIDDIIPFDSLKSDEYDVYLDDEKVISDIYLTETGRHILYIKTEGKQSPNYEFSVVGSDTYMVYETTSFGSEIIGVQMKSKSKDRNYKAGYLTYTDDLELWVEVRMDDEIGYIMISDEDSSLYTLESLYVLAGKRSIEFSVPNKPVFFEHLNGNYYQINIEDRKWLVNIKSGANVEYDRQVAFIDDQVVLYQYPFDFFALGKNEVYDLKIVDLSETEHVVYEYDGKFAYIAGNSNEDSIDFSGSFVMGSYSAEPWYYIDTQIMEETVELRLINDKWVMTVIESPLKDIKDEEVVVYSEFLNFDSEIGTYMVSECKSIEFMNTYDIINDQYALWFEVILSDGSKGYAHRPERTYERRGHLTTIEMHLVKEDGTTYYFEPFYDYMTGDWYLDKGLEKIDSYIITTLWEGSYSTILPKDGSEEMSYMDTKFIEMADNKVIIYQFGYYDEYTNFSIHRMEDKKLIEEYQMPEGWYSLGDLEIVNEGLITFTIMEREDKYLSSLKHSDDGWQIETTYEFEGEN